MHSSFDIAVEFQSWLSKKSGIKCFRSYRSIHTTRKDFEDFLNHQKNEIELIAEGSGMSSWGLYRNKDNEVYMYFYVHKIGFDRRSYTFYKLDMDTFSKDLILY